MAMSVLTLYTCGEKVALKIDETIEGHSTLFHFDEDSGIVTTNILLWETNIINVESKFCSIVENWIAVSSAALCILARKLAFSSPAEEIEMTIAAERRVSTNAGANTNMPSCFI